MSLSLQNSQRMPKLNILTCRSTFRRPIMYVKKLDQFLSSIKKMHTKENWFLFLPHGVVTFWPPSRSESGAISNPRSCCGLVLQVSPVVYSCQRSNRTRIYTIPNLQFLGALCPQIPQRGFRFLRPAGAQLPGLRCRTSLPYAWLQAKRNLNN